MGLNDFLYGTPPQTGIYQAPSMRSPLHGFGRAMSDYLTSLIGAAPPTYQGQLDPGICSGPKSRYPIRCHMT